MKKFYSLLLLGGLLLFGAQSAWANTNHTVGVAGENSNDYTVLLNVNRDSWGWYMWEMAPAGITFEGKKLYVRTYEAPDNNKIWSMQFQYYSGTTYSGWAGTEYSGVWKEQKEPLNNSEATNYYDNYVYNYDEGEWYEKIGVNSSARFYFDASNWSETAIKLCVGHADYQGYYDLLPITNTNLYYGVPGSNWTDAMGIGVVGNTTAEDGENWLTNVSAQASEYTGFKHYGLTATAEGNAYLMVNAGNAGEEPSMSYNDDFRTLLNSTQTLKYAIANEAGEYVEMISGSTPAQIQISSFKFNAGTYDEVTNDKVILSAGGTDYSASVAAARTATTTLMMNNLSADYEFVGWYDGSELISGVTLSIGNTYSYYPTEAKTITACFRAKKYTRSVTNGNYGTICLPRAASIEGADIFEVAGYRGTADDITSVVLVDASTSLVAGKPYIFQATAAELVATYSGDFVAEPVAGANGLIGKFVDASIAANGTSYILRNNAVCKVVDGGSGVTCSANRAYLDFSGMDPVSAPGVRELPMAPENATDIQSIEGKEVAVKFIKDGKLFIQKNGVVYDMTGRIVK